MRLTSLNYCYICHFPDTFAKDLMIEPHVRWSVAGKKNLRLLSVLRDRFKTAVFKQHISEEVIPLPLHFTMFPIILRLLLIDLLVSERSSIILEMFVMHDSLQARVMEPCTLCCQTVTTHSLQ